MSIKEFSKEETILQMMRKTLTQVARDTYTDPALKHPLSEDTINCIRDCLRLITAREAELANEAGRPSVHRPRYVDEPKKSVVVELKPAKNKKNNDRDNKT